MKRTLQILSAFLPLTDALAHSQLGEAATAAFDGAPKSPKNGDALSEDTGAGDDPDAAGSGDGAGGQVSRGTPQAGSSGEAGEVIRAASSGGGSNNPQLQGGGDAGPMMTHAPASNAADYMPLDNGDSSHTPRGGGVVYLRGDTSSSSAADGEPTSTPPSTQIPPLTVDDGPSSSALGPLESDPSDADAMMILLGGLAMGAGEGAQSNGEVILDIVDYGPVTIGFGKATYSASGSQGAVADTFADVEGADIVFMFGYDVSVGGVQSSSTTYVIAIDFEAMPPATMGCDQADFNHYLALIGAQPNDGIHVDGNLSFFTLVADVQDSAAPSVLSASGVTVQDQGSVAVIAGESEQARILLDVSASGIDTLVAASGSLIEVEDHFSSVSGAVTAVA